MGIFQDDNINEENFNDNIFEDDFDDNGQQVTYNGTVYVLKYIPDDDNVFRTWVPQEYDIDDIDSFNQWMEYDYVDENGNQITMTEQEYNRIQEECDRIHNENYNFKLDSDSDSDSDDDEIDDEIDDDIIVDEVRDQDNSDDEEDNESDDEEDNESDDEIDDEEKIKKEIKIRTDEQLNNLSTDDYGRLNFTRQHNLLQDCNTPGSYLKLNEKAYIACESFKFFEQFNISEDEFFTFLNLIEKIQTELEKKNPLGLLLGFYLNINENQKPYIYKNRLADPNKFRSIIDIINSNFDDKISAGDLIRYARFMKNEMIK